MDLFEHINLFGSTYEEGSSHEDISDKELWSVVMKNLKKNVNPPRIDFTVSEIDFTDTSNFEESQVRCSSARSIINRTVQPEFSPVLHSSFDTRLSRKSPSSNFPVSPLSARKSIPLASPQVSRRSSRKSSSFAASPQASRHSSILPSSCTASRRSSRKSSLSLSSQANSRRSSRRSTIPSSTFTASPKSSRYSRGSTSTALPESSIDGKESLRDPIEENNEEDESDVSSLSQDHDYSMPDSPSHSLPEDHTLQECPSNISPLKSPRLSRHLSSNSSLSPPLNREEDSQHSEKSSDPIAEPRILDGSDKESSMSFSPINDQAIELHEHDSHLPEDLVPSCTERDEGRDQSENQNPDQDPTFNLVLSRRSNEQSSETEVAPQVLSPDLCLQISKRSKRTKLPRLESWRGQIPIYEPDENGLLTIRGVTKPSTPDILKRKRRAPVIRKKVSQESVSRSKLTDPDCVSLSNSFVQLSDAARRELQKEIPTFSSLTWKPLKESKDTIMAIERKIELPDLTLAFGYLKLLPLAEKPPLKTAEYELHLTLVEGKATCTIEDHHPFIMDLYETYYIDKRTTYSLKNVCKNEILLKFIILRSH